MAIIKAKQKEYHARVPNETARDKDLSLEAKGLLCILLSMDDKWKIYKTQIADFSTNGLHSTRTAFNELIKKGYIKDHGRQRNGKGFLKDNLYEVFAEKQLLNDSEPICGFHTYDERTQDNRTLSNYTINSIEQEKKEQLEVLNINTETSSVEAQSELFPIIKEVKTLEKKKGPTREKSATNPAVDLIKKYWFEEFRISDKPSSPKGWGIKIKKIKDIVEKIIDYSKNEFKTDPDPDDILQIFKQITQACSSSQSTFYSTIDLNNIESKFSGVIELTKKHINNPNYGKSTYQTQSQRTADAISFFTNL